MEIQKFDSFRIANKLEYSRNMYKLFGFFLGDLRPDPPKPRGDFKKTPRARGVPEGFFLNPRRGWGGSSEDTRRKNPNNMHIFLLISYNYEKLREFLYHLLKYPHKLK